MNFKKIILLTLFISIFLRIYKFGEIPFGINRDEAALGYNAYSILKTNLDEHGKYLPLQFESFGDWKKPVYIYLSTIPIFFLGLSPISTRLISLTASLIMIFYLQKIIKIQFNKYPLLKKASYFTVLFLCLNPWHFFFSRIAVEAMVSASIFVVATYFLIKKRHLLSVILLILSTLTYHSALVFIPLWFAFYIYKDFSKFKSYKSYLSIALFTIFLIFQFQSTFFSTEKFKAKGLVIFDLSLSEQLDILGKRTNKYSILVHNKYLFIGKTFILNYLKTFSPEFLVKQGGGNPSYNLKNFGNFYPVEILLALVGIVYLLKSKNKYSAMYLSWLLFAPIPAAITHEAVHSTREIFLMPVIPVLAAIGASWLVSTSRRPKTSFLILYSLSIIYAFSFFRTYFTDYRIYSDSIYHGYYKDVVFNMKEEKESGNYNKIIVEFFRESPYIFYAFYNKLDPKSFHSSIEYYPRDWEGFVHVRLLDGIIYEGRNEEDIFLKIIPKENNLIYSKPTEIETWIKTFKVWDNLDGGAEIVSWQENQI